MAGAIFAAAGRGNRGSASTRWVTTVLAVFLTGGSVVSASQEERQRGPAATTPHALDGRSRVEARFGVSNLDVSHDGWTDALDVSGGDFSLALVHWPHENLALELSLGATNMGVTSRWTRHGDRVHAEGLYRVMAGARLYLPVKGAFRPHVDLAGGVLTEISVDDSFRRTEVNGRTARAGIEAGGGVDFLLGRHLVVGVRAGTLLREGERSELNLGCTLGWAFGGRR